MFTREEKRPDASQIPHPKERAGGGGEGEQVGRASLDLLTSIRRPVIPCPGDLGDKMVREGGQTAAAFAHSPAKMDGYKT